MAVVAVVAAVGAGLAFFYMLWRLAKGPGARLPKGSKLPPVEGGLPWIGCAKAFGKEPLWYIGKAHKKVTAVVSLLTPPGTCWCTHN